MDRILIVDDEKGMRDLLSIMLKKEGYAVLQAESVDRAREVVARGDLDLVISDISMPGSSGLEVLKQSKAANP
jgi:two-component system, NtrC family, response regulator PilR